MPCPSRVTLQHGIQRSSLVVCLSGQPGYRNRVRSTVPAALAGLALAGLALAVPAELGSLPE
ncbi:unannotated protein [freshwater metagenome]|uniref:Unannotated protein n=1 Tax=freshwater metagenome TaxID=449393 RepID=A0A6J7ABV6_9ZZZZ